jgi:hypothetical protein
MDDLDMWLIDKDAEGLIKPPPGVVYNRPGYSIAFVHDRGRDFTFADIGGRLDAGSGHCVRLTPASARDLPPRTSGSRSTPSRPHRPRRVNATPRAVLPCSPLTTTAAARPAGAATPPDRRPDTAPNHHRRSLPGTATTMAAYLTTTAWSSSANDNAASPAASSRRALTEPAAQSRRGRASCVLASGSPCQPFSSTRHRVLVIPLGPVRPRDLDEAT